MQNPVALEEEIVESPSHLRRLLPKKSSDAGKKQGLIYYIQKGWESMTTNRKDEHIRLALEQTPGYNRL